MINYQTSKTRIHPRRGGATLIEVLMAILIMSIGIVSIATLFPISVLRSLHATQLTNSTILRFNAEGLMDLDTDLIHDPDLDTDYAEHNDTNYFIDPLGWNKYNVSATLNVIQDDVGNDGASPPAVAAKSNPRFNFNITSEDVAANLTTLPDNWVNIVSDFPTASTATSVTFPAGTDFTGALIGSQNSRIVLIDVNGRYSETRQIDAANSGTGLVTWTGDVPFAIARARIETNERMYSYLLSVRKDASGVAQVDVVVYFRRAFNYKNEQVHTLTKIDADEFTLSWTAGNKPALKRGGYLYDMDNGRWHRIQTVDSSTWTANIKLERPTADNITDAMFSSGIVKVYPVGSKVP